MCTFGYSRQRGVFSIISAATLVLAILFLALVVDSGRLYLEQRKLQKLADTAALESISRLESGNCSLETARARQYALDNANSYGFPDGARQSLEAVCVHLSIADGLRVPVPDPGNGRAVEVTTRSQVPASIIVRTGSLFGMPGNSSVLLRAVAVAEKDSDPLAVFSVGAQLLDLNKDGVLGRLLTDVGVRADTLTVLDSSGLLNAETTPAGLLQALGVELSVNQLKALSPEELVNVGKINLEQLISLSANLVGKDQTMVTALGALEQDILNSGLRSVSLNLFGTADVPGIIRLATGSGQRLGSALDAGISLGEVLSAGLMNAVQGRGLLVDSLNILGAAKAQIGVVEPPSIGIGPVGTAAYNAQTRLRIDIDSSGLPLASALLDLLGTSITLPIIIDLVNAKGELTDIDCSRPEPKATIDVESRIGNLCIGNLPAETQWSTRDSCVSAVTDQTLVKLAGIDLIRGKLAVPIISTGSNPVRDVMTLGESESETTLPNTLTPGTLVKNLVPQVLSLVKISAPQNSGGRATFTAEQAGQIADKYLTTLNYNKANIRDRMLSDGLNWKRPAGLLNLGETTMPEDWFGKAPASCSSNKAACRTTLVTSLQTTAQSGVVGSLLGVVGGLVNSLLFGLLGDDAQPLLLKILDPILTLLQGALDGLGSQLSILLTTLGLDLGKSEIKVHSISCGIPRLVG